MKDLQLLGGRNSDFNFWGVAIVTPTSGGVAVVTSTSGGVAMVTQTSGGSQSGSTFHGRVAVWVCCSWGSYVTDFGFMGGSQS